MCALIGCLSSDHTWRGNDTRIVAAVRGEIKGDREALLPGLEILLVELVRLLGGRETRVPEFCRGDGCVMIGHTEEKRARKMI